MVPPPWAEAEAGGMWVQRTGVEGLGMGLCEGGKEASVLSLFPYSST